MPKIKFFAAIIVTCLAISTGSSADSHSTTSQKENAANHLHREIITIQVSSHKKADDANREKSRLKSRGIDAVVDYEQVKDKGMWYRVYIGHFETREAANIFAKDLVEKGIIAGYWVKKKKVPTEALKKEKERQDTAVATATIIQTPDDKTTVTPSETSSPPRQSTIAEEAGSSQLSLTKETQQPEAENKVTENANPKEAPAAPQVNTEISQQNQSKLSLGVKASVLASHKTGDFKVTKSDNGATESWSFGDTYAFFGIVGNYRINDTFTVESSLEKDVLQDIDNWLLAVAVTYQLQPVKWFTPYLRGGGIVGRLIWDDMPGDFDTGLGLEGGLGMHFIKSRFRLGLEASYRYMKYNYNPSAANDITFSDDNLNMSGLVLSGNLSYLF